MKIEKISVIGLGYVGLPTAAIFAARKIKVIGIDVNPDTVCTINRGEIHIVEPALDIVVRAAVKDGFLRASTVPEPADAYLIAVPTPFKGPNHEPDLSYIQSACAAIAPVLSPGNLVILESTSPVGTTERLCDWLAELRPDLSFPNAHGEASEIRVAHCPERVLPGRVMQELVGNDRLIGGMTPRCSEAASQLYQLISTGKCMVASSPRVAEMAKLAENSYRDVNIAFANELSMICSELDVDVWELIELANRHPRVKILQPGPGVGGHCIPVDPWFIVASAPGHAQLIPAARAVNDRKIEWVLERVRQAVGEHLQLHGQLDADHATIACYGLAYKPDIDDLRESPALRVVEALAHECAGRLLVVEPNIEVLPAQLARAQLVGYQEAAAADVHVLLVDHTAFRSATRPDGIVVDSRGIWGGHS